MEKNTTKKHPLKHLARGPLWVPDFIIQLCCSPPSLQTPGRVQHLLQVSGLGIALLMFGDECVGDLEVMEKMSRVLRGLGFGP